MPTAMSGRTTGLQPSRLRPVRACSVTVARHVPLTPNVVSAARRHVAAVTESSLLAVGVRERLDGDDLDAEAAQGNEVGQRLLVVVTREPHLAPVGGVQL